MSRATINRDKSRRTYSKKLAAVNCICAWVTIWISIIFAETIAGIVIPSMLSIIVAMVSIYSGIGHLDFRVANQALEKHMNPSDGVSGE